MSNDMSSEKIKDLFKKLDNRDFEILHLFKEKGPSTRYNILVSTKPLHGINPRIPRATLYRKVKKLIALGFLEEIKKGKFERGKLQSPMPVLSLTYFKGLVASLAHKGPIPDGLKGWFRWHLQYNMDLSDAKLDIGYFLWTGMYALREHPEWFPKELRSMGYRMKKDFYKATQKTNELFKEQLLAVYKNEQQT